MNYNNAPPPPRANNPYNNYQPGNFNGNPGLYVPPNQPNQGYPVNQPYIPNQGFIPGNNPGFIMGAGLMCPCCRRETNNFPKKVAGGVTWIWCFGLFIFTGICCCIPFCVDSCQDTELVCVACQTVKGRIEANCCWLLSDDNSNDENIFNHKFWNQYWSKKNQCFKSLFFMCLAYLLINPVYVCKNFLIFMHTLRKSSIILFSTIYILFHY